MARSFDSAPVSIALIVRAFFAVKVVGVGDRADGGTVVVIGMRDGGDNGGGDLDDLASAMAAASEIDVEEPGPEIYARIGDLEVSVCGGTDSDLFEVGSMFERQFETVLKAYVEHRDDGVFY